MGAIICENQEAVTCTTNGSHNVREKKKKMQVHQPHVKDQFQFGAQGFQARDPDRSITRFFFCNYHDAVLYVHADSSPTSVGLAPPPPETNFSQGRFQGGANSIIA